METITIARSEYDELVNKAERIETVKRMYERGRFLSEEDIKIILNIVETRGYEDGKI